MEIRDALAVGIRFLLANAQTQTGVQVPEASEFLEILHIAGIIRARQLAEKRSRSSSGRIDERSECRIVVKDICGELARPLHVRANPEVQVIETGRIDAQVSRTTEIAELLPLARRASAILHLTVARLLLCLLAKLADSSPAR